MVRILCIYLANLVSLIDGSSDLGNLSKANPSGITKDNGEGPIALDAEIKDKKPITPTKFHCAVKKAIPKADCRKPLLDCH